LVPALGWILSVSVLVEVLVGGGGNQLNGVLFTRVVPKIKKKTRKKRRKKKKMISLKLQVPFVSFKERSM